jgi:hypothetical protein
VTEKCKFFGMVWNFTEKKRLCTTLLTNLLNRKIEHLSWKSLNLKDIMLKSNSIQFFSYSFIDTWFSFSLFFLVMNHVFSSIALQHSYTMNLMMHESKCWAWHEMKWNETCEDFSTLVYLLFDYNYVTYEYK